MSEQSPPALSDSNITPEKRLMRIGCWQIIVLIGGCVVLLVLSYYLLFSVYISEVPEDANVNHEYFPPRFYDDVKQEFTNKDIKYRNILQVEGRFHGSGPSLDVTLYAVEGGIIKEGSSMSVGESSGRIDMVVGEKLHILFALCEYQNYFGHFITLGCVGHTRAAGNVAPLPNTVKANIQMVFPGMIPRLSPCITYLEGEESPIVSRNMSIDDFAAKNPGKYLVITMQMK
jgi:hypothetical protein